MYLLPQHFSAIAAAGPIAGPILACQQFGWLPALLWIGLGVVFIGAVHDFSTLVASVRHDAGSICEVVRVQLGQRAYLAIMGFIWLALLYVILAFTDVTASTFVSGDVDTAGLALPGPRFNPGGAVALASVLYLGLSVVMGLVERFLQPPLWLQTLVFVPPTLGAVWLGTRHSTVLVLDAKTWAALILGYCFVASLVPVWALLQPRGYLGGFVLYLALAVGVIGILFGNFPIRQDAWKGFIVPGPTGLLFPFLFVTIACGACSGFHGLVCSGTTSKQIAREPHCKPIGYGAMLLEGFVALIALATVMIASGAELTGKAPGAIYGQGLGRFVTVLIGEEHLVLRRHVRGDGVLHLRVRHPGRQHPAGPLHPAGAAGLEGPRGGDGRHGPDVFSAPGDIVGGGRRQLPTRSGPCSEPPTSCWPALSLLAITVWLRRSGRNFALALVPGAVGAGGDPDRAGAAARPGIRNRGVLDRPLERAGLGRAAGPGRAAADHDRARSSAKDPGHPAASLRHRHDGVVRSISMAANDP